MALLRDPKTGRILPKAKAQIKTTDSTIPNPLALEFSKKLEIVLASPLGVFNRKDISGPSRMGPGSAIILEKLPVRDTSGSYIFRVKRAKSDRTYYTTEEMVGALVF